MFNLPKIVFTYMASSFPHNWKNRCRAAICYHHFTNGDTEARGGEFLFPQSLAEQGTRTQIFLPSSRVLSIAVYQKEVFEKNLGKFFC